jgi:hypothetical protein
MWRITVQNNMEKVVARSAMLNTEDRRHTNAKFMKPKSAPDFPLFNAVINLVAQVD